MHPTSRWMWIPPVEFVDCSGFFSAHWRSEVVLVAWFHPSPPVGLTRGIRVGCDPKSALALQSLEALVFLLRLLDEWYDNCTVDGSEIRRSPPGIYNTLYIMGSLPYQLVQDFFHQQYDNDTVLNISRTSLLFKPMLNFIELFFSIAIWRSHFLPRSAGDTILLMEEILHHLGIKNPLNNGTNYLSSGAGFLSSTVVPSSWPGHDTIASWRCDQTSTEVLVLLWSGMTKSSAGRFLEMQRVNDFVNGKTI